MVFVVALDVASAVLVVHLVVVFATAVGRHGQVGEQPRRHLHGVDPRHDGDGRTPVLVLVLVLVLREGRRARRRQGQEDARRTSVAVPSGSDCRGSWIQRPTP